MALCPHRHPLQQQLRKPVILRMLHSSYSIQAEALPGVHSCLFKNITLGQAWIPPVGSLPTSVSDISYKLPLTNLKLQMTCDDIKICTPQYKSLNLLLAQDMMIHEAAFLLSRSTALLSPRDPNIPKTQALRLFSQGH